MIDLDREALMTLAEASALVPGRQRRGPDGQLHKKKTAASTLWRWHKFGARGVYLEAVRRPCGTYLTTKAAVYRFLAAYDAVDAAPRAPSWSAALDDRWANARLDQLGIGRPRPQKG
jgi:hypothetical protein